MLILESSIQLTLRMGRKGVSRVWRMHDSLHVRSTLQLLLVSICLFGVVVEDPLSGKFCWRPVSRQRFVEGSFPGKAFLKSHCQAIFCWRPFARQSFVEARCQAKFCWRPVARQSVVEGPLPVKILLKARCQATFCWRPIASQSFVEGPLPGNILLKAHCQAKCCWRPIARQNFLTLSNIFSFTYYNQSTHTCRSIPVPRAFCLMQLCPHHVFSRINHR